MALSIKNPETVAAVHAAAQYYGTSYTQAITLACTQAIQQSSPTLITTTLSAIERITTAYRDNLPPGPPIHDIDLYDEVGLPA